METTNRTRTKSNTHRLHGVYAITPYHPQNPPSTRILIDQLDAVLSSGVKIVQYRSKSPDSGLLREQAQAIKALCGRYQAILIINDDVSLACYVEAHGVHLGVNDITLSQARDQLPENAIIGVSCYNRLDLAQAAQYDGADYVAFGRFFPSKTKPEAVQAPLELLSAAKRSLDIPVACIGGITRENAKMLISAGADMLAIIEGIFGQDDIREVTRQLVDLIQ